jgi:ABC-type antimicrobial peptide transport system permease subunit
VAQIHAVDPDVVVHEIRTMPDRLYASLARQRFAMSLLGSFSVFAMMLAAIGVYGVISYLVSQNTHEIGIRIALGAPTAGVLGMVVRQGLTLAGIGIFAGIIGAMALTRLMASLLFGVSALDFGTFVSVPSILALVALAATVIPATRVLRVAPSVALRQD